MRPTGVVVPDPVADDPRGVLLRLEAMTMGALFFERSDHPLDHPVLLRAERTHQALDYGRPDDVYYGRPTVRMAA